VFTRARHWFVSRAESILSTLSHPISPRPILILSSHLYLGIQSRFFPSGFPTTTARMFLLFHARYTPKSITYLASIVLIIYREDCILCSSYCTFLHHYSPHSLLRQNIELCNLFWGPNIRDNLVLIAVTVKLTVFCDVTTYNPAYMGRCFKGTCFIYNVHWSKRQHVPPKSQYISTRIYGITPQASVIVTLVLWSSLNVKDQGSNTYKTTTKKSAVLIVFIKRLQQTRPRTELGCRVKPKETKMFY
jgi:hypothetical protein